MERSPRTLLLVGSFAVVLLVAGVVAAGTVSALVTYMSADAQASASVEAVEPVEGEEALRVRLELSNPTRSALTFRAVELRAYERVDGEERYVGDASGAGFAETRVPPGESRTVTALVTLRGDVEAARQAAREDRVVVKGRAFAEVVDRTVYVSVEDDG